MGNDVAESSMLVDVLVDVPSVDRAFVYAVDATTTRQAQVVVGSVVRVPFAGRSVDGWITALNVEAPSANVRAVERVMSVGPSAEVIELARWAAWRWFGALAFFVKAASPATRVRALPRPSGLASKTRSWQSSAIVRVHAPGADRLAYVRAMIERGPTLVLCPTMVDVHALVSRLRRAGVPVAEFANDWSQAAAGGAVVVGARSAALASVPDLAGIVVLDADDPLYRDERAPTWNAVDLVLHRGEVQGIAVELLTSAGSPFMWQWTNDVRAEPASTTWPRLDIVDLGQQDPRHGILTTQLVDVCRSATSAAVVLNRQGQAQLLRCTSCKELVTCTRCSASMRKLEGNDLTCPVCGDTRPGVCAHCGSTSLSVIRPGAAKMADDLAAALQRPVGEVTSKSTSLPDTPVLVGTESVLRRGRSFDVVVFADIDRDLLAPRVDAYQRVTLQVSRAARLVSRSTSGRVLLQTREPSHAVLKSLQAGDVVAGTMVELERRQLLGLPPACAMARLSGPGAPELASRLDGVLGLGVAPIDDQYLVRAPDVTTLADALRTAGRPSGKVRIEVDPIL